MLIVQGRRYLLSAITSTDVFLAVRQLERARDSYNGNEGEVGSNGAGGSNHNDGEEDSSEEAAVNGSGGGGGAYARRTKKMKTNGNY